MIWTAFVLGILGSFHCVGMCGPIAFMLPVGKSKPVKKLLQVTLYHLGRLISYTALGLLFGSIGSAFFTFGVQQQLSIIIGIIILLLVIFPSKRFEKISFLKPVYTLFYKIQAHLGASLKKEGYASLFQLGLLNGLLPCGLVYMAIFASLALGSLWQSSLYMVFFGLGTIPMMTGVIYFRGFIQKVLKFNPRRIIPYAVAVMGILFILRGLGLGIPYVSPKPMTEKVTSSMECH
jgi:sulfite exporter TauE/SafE